MKRRSIALAVLLGTAGLGVMAAAPAASAAPPGCVVIDTNSNQNYAGLQDAVTAAAPGDTLFVKGTCTGNTVIGENLTITGKTDGGQKTATLTGGGFGTVLHIDSGAVTLNALVITGGGTPDTEGGGIYNDDGAVTLNNSTVTGNNIAAGNGGGGIFNNIGTVTLNNSTVTGNTANNDTSGGGGIYNLNGTVTLTGSSTVTGNSATGFMTEGGGILNCGTLVNAIAAPAADANVYNNQPTDIVNVSPPCTGG